MTEETPIEEAPTYKDDDLVYVDPDTKMVVGLVQWHANGNPKSLQRSVPVTERDVVEEEPSTVKPDAKRPVRRPVTRLRYYPWGTYRSMKRIYKLEGKLPREESPYTLNDVIEKALSQPFWD